MENKNFLNSPVIQRHTPIKRLGLSRKRKSSGSGDRIDANIQDSSEKSRRLDLKTKGVNEPEKADENTVKHLNYAKELEVLKTRILEKEEKWKTLQQNKNILELEDLIEVWKTGCKNAYLEFMQLLKDKEPSFKPNDVLNKLGIQETMLKHFKHDSDISLFSE